MALLMAAMSLLGVIQFSISPQSPLTLLGHAIAYAAIFALTALSEEGLLRGYVLIQLSRAIAFWPAAFVTSLIFAALHLVHGNETAMGLVQVGLFGMVMSISVWRTQGLWFALGFHAAWDFSETFIFGVADSGMTGEGALLSAQTNGPVWLTGGAVGPEGSILVLPLLALMAVLIMIAWPADGQPEHEPLSL
jgi:membrane protease YdiL (CAAX protease family)